MAGQLITIDQIDSFKSVRDFPADSVIEPVIERVQELDELTYEWDFDGKKCTKEYGIYNYLQGELFTAQTFENIPKSDGRQIQIGRATIESPKMPFNMLMGFPTELTLRTTNDGIRMFNEPDRSFCKSW